jgi:Flp pilus assembly protein TadG
MHGAVAVEFAIIFPVLMLMLTGIFGLGVVMIEDMQLAFVVERAATAATPAAGVAWATTQLGPPASFTGANATCGKLITGQWPISLGIFPSLTLSQTACSP